MKAAVLGSPIAHSLSPAVHAAGYAALGLTDWSYTLVEMDVAGLPGFVAGLDEQWRGLSLTMPLKEVCLEVAGVVTPLAQRAGAGNTLVRQEEGGWLADNTDVPGLVDALSPAWQREWTRAAILGAGATARSAVLALASMGVPDVTVFARSAERALSLREWAATAAPDVTLGVEPLVRWTTGTHPAVLSTLPGAAADHFVLPGRRTGLLFDAVYASWPTPLARAAASAGMTVVGGLDLLVHQAARQFELFTGLPAPIEAMLAAGRAAEEAAR